MDQKLIWTEKASSDIEAIIHYIARRDLAASAQIGFGIYDRAQISLQHPEAGTLLDELRESGWRKLIVRRWKIVYTIRADSIIVGIVWPPVMGEADFETSL